MRRVQGLCLIFIGAVLGWSSGGDLRGLLHGPGASARPPGWMWDPQGGLHDTLWVGGKLLLALGVIFVGVVFLAGWRARPAQGADDEPRSPRR